MQPHDGPATYAITAIVVVAVMAFRWRRMGRQHPLRLERLWVLPAVYGAAVAIVVAQMPPTGRTWAWCGVALLLGAALGWQRGRMMRIAVDPRTHALSQTSSPAAMLFILAIVLVRQGARGASGWAHLDPAALTDMLMAFALGLFTAQRLEMFLRARRLLAAARATRR